MFESRLPWLSIAACGLPAVPLVKFASGFGLTLPMADKAREQLTAFVKPAAARRDPAAIVEIYKK